MKRTQQIVKKCTKLWRDTRNVKGENPNTGYDNIGKANHWRVGKCLSTRNGITANTKTLKISKTKSENDLGK